MYGKGREAVISLVLQLSGTEVGTIRVIRCCEMITKIEILAFEIFDMRPPVLCTNYIYYPRFY